MITPFNTHVRILSGLRKAAALPILLLLAATMTHAAGANPFLAGDLVIEDPRTPAPPPGARVAAGYLVIRNSGTAPDRLVAVETAIAARAEIHETDVDAAGVMTMRPLPEGLEIPAGGEVELRQGSLHLMFFELGHVPAEGGSFAATLIFERADAMEIDFAVEARGGGEGGGHGHGAHGHHSH